MRREDGDLQGLLFIGDPHLASRVPGFRRDDYPRVILDKLKFALAYAREHRLLPVLLGDLFEFPRDNANWLLVELFRVLDRGTLAIHGNHDCKEDTLAENDSFSVLVESGQIRLLCGEEPWIGRMNGCTVVVGGTSWGQDVPDSFDRTPYENAGNPVFVAWATHHDFCFPEYDGRLRCRDTPGIDLVVNGHLHRKLADVRSKTTLWMNPGNISRLARGSATREHVPSVLRVDVSSATGFAPSRVPLPHRSFDEVFHPDVQGEPVEVGPSQFIRELAKLQAARTTTGVGLREFLDANLVNFEPKVAAYINALAAEVTSNGTTDDDNDNVE
jgi:DNA repair exonuclease SbcCD nuclease subunit